ncbi:MAG: hypothetical protein ACXWJ4_01770 [Methyloceanibacter sp.]
MKALTFSTFCPLERSSGLLIYPVGAIQSKKAIDFTGQPPEEGSFIGFNLATGKDDKGPSTVTEQKPQ